MWKPSICCQSRIDRNKTLVISNTQGWIQAWNTLIQKKPSHVGLLRLVLRQRVKCRTPWTGGARESETNSWQNQAIDYSDTKFSRSVFRGSSPTRADQELLHTYPHRRPSRTRSRECSPTNLQIGATTTDRGSTPSRNASPLLDLEGLRRRKLLRNSRVAAMRAPP